MSKNQWNRIMFSVLGLFLVGIAIGITRIADFGNDPYTTFIEGMSAIFNMSFGNILFIINMIGLVLVFFLGRKFIGLGTILNILIVGFVADYTYNTIISEFGDAYSLDVRLLFVIVGLLVLGIGAGMYISADRGVSPNDAMALIIETRSNGNISFQVARVALDVTYLILGYFSGATIGIVTVVAGFLMGPIVQYFRNYFAKLLAEAEEAALKNSIESA